MGSGRMAFFIILASYVSFLFQSEHPIWQWSQILIGITFAGYVRYRGAFYNTSILENQLLLATLFRMMARVSNFVFLGNENLSENRYFSGNCPKILET